VSYTPKEGNAHGGARECAKEGIEGCGKKGRRPRAAYARARENDARGTARETHLTDVAPHYYFADTDDSILVRCCCTAAHGATATVRFFLRSPRDLEIRRENREKSSWNRPTAVRGTEVPRYFGRGHDEVLFRKCPSSLSFSLSLSLSLSLPLCLSHSLTLSFLTPRLFLGMCLLAFRYFLFFFFYFYVTHSLT